MGLSRCSRCPIWCADATHTQNLAKSDPATTPAPWTVQWHLKALKSARGLRRNRISPRSFPRDTCDNLRPNRPWRSPRVKNQAIELANSSHWRGRCSHVDSVEKSAYAKHLRTNKDPPLPRSDPHLCPKSLILVEPKSCFHAGDFVARRGAIASICAGPCGRLRCASRWYTKTHRLAESLTRLK